MSTPRKRRKRAAPARRLCELLEPRQLLSGDGRPTATLEAQPIDTWSSTYTFRVVYTDDVSIDLNTLDDTDLTISGPNGYKRNARFYRAEASNGGRTVHTWYKISAPAGLWDATDNGTYRVGINPHQVRDGVGNSARAVTIGTFYVGVPHFPSEVSAGMLTKGIIGVDVRSFGANPDDGIDDTDAIQRAISAMRLDGDGVPDPAQPIGGTLVFPKGTFNTSRPLQIPAGVRVRGHGIGTVIANNSSNSSEGVFELMTYSDHGYNIRAGIENLKITTTAAKGIIAAPELEHLLSLRLNDLTISAGGVAIDLRDVRTYAAELRNVTVENPGSTALWMGPPDDSWISNVNRINGFQVTGTARPNFQAERGLVVLGGDINVDGLKIANTGAPVTPLWATVAPILRNVQILATQNLPGGVLATFENCAFVDIDRLDISSSRKIELRNTKNVSIGSVTLTSGSHLRDSVVLDAASHVSIEMLRASSSAGPLTDARLIVRTQAQPERDPPVLPVWHREPLRPVSQTVRDVTHFGAFPDDGVDDTAAIQAAIDALPTGSGIPGVGSEYTGGLVLMPAGTFQTSGPLRIPSGVWLRGQGNATVIYNTATDDARGAIELVSRHSHGYNVGAAVEDLSIYTTHAMGVRADTSISAALVDLRLSGLMIGAGFRTIDLGAVTSYHSWINNIVAYAPGSTLLVIGDVEGYSADNRVMGLQPYGAGRPEFRAERALVELRGDTYYQAGWLEHPFVRVTPLYVSGTATIRGLWTEYAAHLLPEGVVAHFENTTSVDVDRMIHISGSQRLRLVNAKGVRIGMLDLHGFSQPLRDTITVDDHSRLTIGMVYAQRDAGMLDHPRVRVQSFYNIMDRTLIENRSPAQNLLADPLFTSFITSPDRSDESGGETGPGWTIYWGDHLGAITGTASVEQTPRGPRLKITITSNPNNRHVSVIANVNVAAHQVGKHGVARWRLDGPGQALVYREYYGNEYSARAMQGTTAGRTPLPMRTDERLVFALPGVGTYYLSDVSLTPIG